MNEPVLPEQRGESVPVAPKGERPAVFPLHRLSTVEPEEWRLLYREASAVGRGCVIEAELERTAAPDELVALTLSGLVRLGSYGLLADGSPGPAPGFADALSRESGSVLRLLDRALAAHGRDHGYPVAAWLDHALTAAHALALVSSRLAEAAMPLTILVEEAVDAVAAAVMALHRDRLGVAEELSFALASLLVLYVAAHEGDD